MISLFLNLLKAFAIGGAICVIGEFLVLKTKLTPARILVGYIVLGVILSAIGIYGPLVDFAGAGATIPLTGFGHALTNGVKKPCRRSAFSVRSPADSPVQPQASQPQSFSAH